MHDLLMDMKALNLQNRTFAIIENGSWAVKSGDLMQKFVNNELKIIQFTTALLLSSKLKKKSLLFLNRKQH